MALNLNFPQGRIGRLGLISLVLFILTIPLGNWVVTNVGLVCDPHGPCLIPVWPGVWSPSAVMVAGLALVLRDAVQSILGNLWAVAAIAAGALLSYLLADPAVVLGSTAAFLFSELADFCCLYADASALPKLGSSCVRSGGFGGRQHDFPVARLRFAGLSFWTGAWQVLDESPRRRSALVYPLSAAPC